MLGLSREKLAEITGARVLPSEERLSFRGLEFDSREIRGGELFVALKGTGMHGHQFVDTAFSRGAALCLVEDPKLLESHPEAARLVLVSDTQKAFDTLARWWRRELGLPLVAVTGSVGKTTAKEMAAAVLMAHGPGNYSLKSHNNHVGVPYTLCRMGHEHLWAVLEVGMSAKGEIAALGRMAEANLAAITTIAPAHIENLGSIEAIADAKFEILEGLSPTGALILNGDDPELRAGLKRHDLAGRKVYFFGRAADASSRILDMRMLGLDGLWLKLELFGEALEVSMPVLGAHNALNAACAALIAKLLIPAMSTQQIATGLSRFKAPLMRLNLRTLRSGRRVIDDSYNANPASMRASLELLGELKAQGSRVGLIIGDMLELGAHARGFHEELAGQVAALRPDFVIAVGAFAECLIEGATKAGVPAFVAENPEAAAQIARKFNFDVLLVKASRGVALDKAVALLMEREGAEFEAPVPRPDHDVTERLSEGTDAGFKEQ